MPVDYEAEYNNRARVPEHPEIFARWAKDAPTYREQAARDGRAELGLSYGPSKRQIIDLFKTGRTMRRVAHVHPWRLLARARAGLVQPHGVWTERAWRDRRNRGLRSLSAGHHRRNHRSDARRLSVSVAPAEQAHHGLWPFRRRTPRRRHAGDRLAGARPESAARSRAGGLFDFRGVRSDAPDRGFDECRSAA